MPVRHIIFSITLVCTVFLGFGCKGLDTQQQAAITPVTINYWTVFNDVDMLRQFAAAYQQLHPYVTINIKQVRYSEFDSLLLNALADDIQPDIVSLHVHWLRKYVSRLAVMPASVQVADVKVKGQYLKEVDVRVYDQPLPTANMVEANFITTVSDDVIINNRIYGLPLAMDTLAIYYNKTLLDRAGIATPPETWDEFVEAVKKTTIINPRGDIIQSGVALGTANNIDHAADILALFMMQNDLQVSSGNKVVFASGLEKRVDPNNPMIGALQFYTDFAMPTKEAYSWNETQADALRSFALGKSVFYIGYAFEADDIRRLGRQIDWAVIPIPQRDPSKPANVSNYWVETVLEKSRHQDEAWDFIRFITTPENIALYVEATKQPTPLRAQIEGQRQDPVLAPFVDQLLNAQNWYQGKNIDAAKEAFATLIDRYREPFGEEENALERDANLIIQAARTIQQTY